MAKTKQTETLVKVELRHSLKYGGRLRPPGAVIELPLSVVEDLEETGAFDRVFDPPDVQAATPETPAEPATTAETPAATGDQ